MKNLLIEKYFDQNSLISSNIESFTNFVEKGMKDVVKEVGEITPTIIPQDINEFKIRFEKVWVEKPQIIEADGSRRDVYPSEARLRKLTYSAPIYLDVSVYIDGVEREKFTTQVGKLPIMLKSKFCHLYNLTKEQLVEQYEDPNDPGGYFILNGNERVLITVEDLASNKLFVEKSSAGPSKYTAQLFSEKGAYRIPHLIEQMKDGVIYLSFTRFKRIPIITLIKALGLTKDEDIVNAISSEQQFDDIFINLLKASEFKKEEDALEHLAGTIGLTMQPKDVKITKMKENLDRYLLPHLGTTPKQRLSKAYNLCKLIKKFLIITKNEIVLAKDHYNNKRLRLSGDLLMDLFRVNLRALINDLLYNFQRLVKRGKFSSLKIIIRDKLLTSRIKSAMATGTWVGGRKGISQNLDRTNFLASVSHLQRVVSLLSTAQENFEARALHPTHFGRLCLSKDTHILLADQYSTRTLEQLQNCWKHHEISTINTDKKTIKNSKIIKYFASNPKLMGKKVYKIQAESGREIIATCDHPFYTKEGWKDAKKLNKNDFVAVYPTLDNVETPNPPTVEKGIILVNEDDIKKSYPRRHKHYIKELKNRDLLPFTINNYYAEIIARLQGHILTDGHCGKYNLEFYCGSKKDAEEVAKDIRLLGFKPSKINKKIGKFISKDGRTIINTTYRLTKGSPLQALLVQLGTPIGKKTDKKYHVPRWLFKTKLSVKREFLAAYLGGDGNKPRWNRKVQIDNLFFHKNEKLKKNALQYAKELIKLFNDLEINIKRIKIEDAYTRKNGSKTIKVTLMFSKSNKNYKNLLQKIGYRYCIRKSKEAMLIGEWLRLHEKKLKDKIKLKQRIRQLHQQGLTPKQISKKIENVSYRMINSWLYERKYDKTSIARSGLLPYDKWVKKRTIKSNPFLIWQKITSKELTELDDVRDLTTKEDTHTMITNGFLTHNCPIETPEGTSIGLRKNLALLCNITQKEVSEEKIRKQLENYGLKKW